MQDSFIDLSEDLFGLFDFFPLNCPDTDYLMSLLSNTIIREDIGFCNNIALNVIHFYNYILHTFLCKLYRHENNIDLLNYILKTQNSLGKKDASVHIPTPIEYKYLNTKLFLSLEKDSINYFFHLLKMDKGHHISQKHQHIFNIRNDIAHLNYINIDREKLRKLISEIIDVLNFISDKLYQMVKKFLYEELDALIRRNLMDESNYQTYIEEINRKYYLNKIDYSLLMKKNFFKELSEKSYKHYIKLYIENFTDISI